MKNEKNYNQYEMVLAMSLFIRQNPDDPRVLELKQCRSQEDQFKIFEKL